MSETTELERLRAERMNCPICTEPMKEYVGFNMISSGQFDCVNKNCAPKKKAPTLGAYEIGKFAESRDWGVVTSNGPLSFKHLDLVDAARYRVDQFRGAGILHARIHRGSIPHSYDRLIITNVTAGYERYEYHIPIPTRSIPNPFQQATSAMQASSQPRHTPPYQISTGTWQANGPQPACPIPDCDEPDQ